MVDLFGIAKPPVDYSINSFILQLFINLAAFDKFSDEL